MIPAVDGLLPKTHNSMIITLLYRLAEWHALAKLRVHTEQTLDSLEKSTTIIGRELRSFRDKSVKSFKCQELPKETAARQRQKERAQSRKESGSASTNINVNCPLADNRVPGLQTDAGGDTRKTSANEGAVPPSKPKPKPKLKTLNLFTYKFHALGDYVRTIRLFGTTDSYSTQIVSATSSPLFRH
jgi:hypothetical protein